MLCGAKGMLRTPRFVRTDGTVDPGTCVVMRGPRKVIGMGFIGQLHFVGCEYGV
ncbi:hypothetical protein J31TS4_14960 [Paenibacillus sp. J31TS4]|nr:hypothetical protein J31TS4_14960 [Paenibacillus sp. J31TS4]